MGQLIVQPSSADSYLDENLPTRNESTDNNIRVRSRTVENLRGIIRFDFSALPVGAIISDAQLSLNMHKATDPGRTYLVYEVTRKDWAIATVSWDHYSGTTHWTTPGGDYTTDLGASAVVPANDGDWMTWTITDLAKHFQANHSCIADLLIKDSVDNSATDDNNEFESNETGSGASLRPKLTINYTLPESGASPIMFLGF